MSSSTLKPCPFCGSPNVKKTTLGGMFRIRKVIECQGCKATGPVHHYFADQWNQRKPEPGPCEQCGARTTRKLHELNAYSCSGPCDRAIELVGDYRNA